ncbi:MAG: YdcH family protein [Alphaproteobacteria bacterium]
MPDEPLQPETTPEERLARLRQEHRDLDDSIARLSEAGPINQLEVQRLKRRKLSLRDQIARLESGRYPDIIA